MLTKLLARRADKGAAKPAAPLIEVLGSAGTEPPEVLELNSDKENTATIKDNIVKPDRKQAGK